MNPATIRPGSPFIVPRQEGLVTLLIEESGKYRVELNHAGAEVEIRGGWKTMGTEKIEVSIEIVHTAPHTRSRTLLRGVAEDQSQIALSGTIFVEESAPDTNAFLTENILLLSPNAVAHAIPNLEIHVDEVKCSHAATVSPIPKEHLFYLQSRGLTHQEATHLIVSGFLQEAHFTTSSSEVE